MFRERSSSGGCFVLFSSGRGCLEKTRVVVTGTRSCLRAGPGFLAALTSVPVIHPHRSDTALCHLILSPAQREVWLLRRTDPQTSHSQAVAPPRQLRVTQLMPARHLNATTQVICSEALIEPAGGQQQTSVLCGPLFNSLILLWGRLPVSCVRTAF